MNIVARNFRGLLIAVVALSMSAGLASAAHPTADRQANGVTQANSSETADPNETEAPEGTEAPDRTEAPEGTESPDSSSGSGGDNCTTDPTGLTSDQVGALTHGQIVCWAAQQDTPEGWDNHGAWVSHWAQMNKGSDASSTGKDKSASHRNGHASH